MTASEYRYMRAIDKFAKDGRAAKMTDVAVDLGYARASVYKKFCLLEQQGLIKKRDDKSVVMTDEGAKRFAEQSEVCAVCARMLSRDCRNRCCGTTQCRWQGRCRTVAAPRS